MKFFISLALAVTTFLLSPATTAEAAVTGTCEIAAHRGKTNVSTYTATENGMEAFKRSTDLGVDWIEADVRASSDDWPMLMHDATVDRTTDGSGYVRQLSAAKIKTYLMNDGSRVPYLSELATHAATTGTKLLIELKATGGQLWWQRLAETLNAYPSKVVLQSGSTGILDKAALYMPTLGRGLLSWKTVPVETAQKYGSVVLDKAVLSESYSTQLDGVAVYPFLVSNTTDWSKFATRVDAMLTDNPGRLMTYRTTTPACQAQ